MYLNEEDRKLLTGYIGECWDSVHASAPKDCNRTFATLDDLFAVYSKMVKEGDWATFENYQFDTHPGLLFCDGEFTAWLFCLDRVDQVPDRMKLAVEWIREDV